MDVTYGRLCGECEYGSGGFDVRHHGTYVRYCTHPDMKSNSNLNIENAPPVCGWRGDYPLFVKSVDKQVLVEDVMFKLGSELYDGLKGRLLSVLESQVDNPDKLKALKSITGDILSQSERDIKEYLVAVFENWGIEK